MSCRYYYCNPPTLERRDANLKDLDTQYDTIACFGASTLPRSNLGWRDYGSQVTIRTLRRLEMAVCKTLFKEYPFTSSLCEIDLVH